MKNYKITTINIQPMFLLGYMNGDYEDINTKVITTTIIIITTTTTTVIATIIK